MKLNKKELNQIIASYQYNEGEWKDAIKQTLIILGCYTQVTNEIFKLNHRRAAEQIETMEKILDKAYFPKRVINFKLIYVYEDDIIFMERITDDEKKVLRACIDYIKMVEQVA